jgi:hypothetical protein
MESIKSKQIGDKQGNEALKNGLVKEMKDFEKTNTLEITSIIVGRINEHLTTHKNMPHNKIVCLQNVFSIFSSLIKTDEEMLKKFKDKFVQEHLQCEINKLINQIYRAGKIMLVENQNLNDLVRECDRLKALFKYYEAKTEAKKPINDLNKSIQIGDKLVKLEHLLVNKISPFNDKMKLVVDGLLNDLKSLLKIELSKEERLMIHTAMGLSKGHWFKCKNGHVYCITECGGAMEKSRCPDCNCEIGGTNHTLLADNQLASEMDGAQHAAWSETANNMANWNLNNI